MRLYCCAKVSVHVQVHALCVYELHTVALHTFSNGL